LTPLSRDWMGVVPMALTAALLLARPKLVGSLARRGWGAHLLELETIRRIDSAEFPSQPL
jgi:hypothetical protein